MDRLRTGCPWDREQTHLSLTKYLLEEAYEVIEAIENDDYDHLREELGDLLLQVYFHARIAGGGRRARLHHRGRRARHRRQARLPPPARVRRAGGRRRRRGRPQLGGAQGCREAANLSRRGSADGAAGAAARRQGALALREAGHRARRGRRVLGRPGAARWWSRPGPTGSTPSRSCASPYAGSSTARREVSPALRRTVGELRPIAVAFGRSASLSVRRLPPTPRRKMMSALFRFLTVALVAVGLAAFPSMRATEHRRGRRRGAPAMPPIKHVFMIVYENKGYDATWGADSAAPYLAEDAAEQGRAGDELLRHRPRLARQLHRDGVGPRPEPADPERLPVLHRLRACHDRGPGSGGRRPAASSRPTSPPSRASSTRLTAPGAATWSRWARPAATRT